MSRNKLLTGAALPLLLTLFFSLAAFLYGNPGFKVDKSQHGLWISQVTNSQLNPVQSGDLIIAVNKIPYSKVLGHLILQTTPSTSNTITLLRKGQQITFPLTTIPFTLSSFLLLVWPHFLLILLFLTLGSIALIYAPPDQTTRLFFLMLCGFSCSIASTLVSHTGIMDPSLISMSFFCLALSNWLAFGAWIHFAWRFPSERDLLKKRSWPAALFYLLPPAATVSGALFAAGFNPEFWSWLQRLRNLFLPLIILGTFTKHLIDFIKLPPQPAKNQIKLPLAAYWLTFSPYFFFYLLPNLLIDRPLIHFRTVILTFLFLPLAYLFALLRYRLFQVDRMISKILAYVILIISTTLLYSFFLIVLKRWIWGNQVLSEELFLAFLVIVIALFNPLANRLQKTIDRFIFGNKPYPPLLLNKLSRQINTALDIPDLVQAVLLDMPKYFAIRRAGILIMDEKTNPLPAKSPILEPKKWASSRLSNKLRGHNDYFHCHTVANDPQLTSELEEIRQAGYSMVFGLQGNSSLIGLLFIGPKINGRLFTSEDTHFFATLANHTGIALENSLRYESLSKSKQQLEELFEQLVQQKKMAAIGEMSMVLAHELKNPLAVIRSSAQHLSTGKSSPEIMQEILTFIIEEVDNLNLTISSLLGHARHRAPIFQPIEIQTAIPALIEKWKLSAAHTPDIHIDCDIPEHFPTLYTDMSQLGQILLNLIRNSEEAMGRTGNITLLATRDQDMSVIRISDNGPGISPEDLKDVFKNFFSTKTRGLGLGLSVCQQLIQAHNGTISIRNGEENGAEVTIRLPFKPQSPKKQATTPTTP